MEESFLAELFIYILLAGLVVGIILAFRSGFKGGNSVTVFGATADMYTKDKRAAMETLTEVKAKKKMEEEENGEPK